MTDLLSQLPNLFQGNLETGSALGSALQAAYKLMVGIILLSLYMPVMLALCILKVLKNVIITTLRTSPLVLQSLPLKKDLSMVYKFYSTSKILGK